MLSKFPYTDLVFSITETIDLINPVLANHNKLVAYIAHSLGKRLELSVYEQMELEIAGSLHDVGGLTSSEKFEPSGSDYEDINFHSERGYLLLRKFKPFSNIAKMIRYHHRAWCNGKCTGISGEEIPFGSHILNLADRVAMLINKEDRNILSQVDYIVAKIKANEGTIFHPKIVKAFIDLSVIDSFWLEMNYLELPNYLNEANEFNYININEKQFQDFMIVLCHIIDFKSRFTAAHSSTIAACAGCIARFAGFSEEEIEMIKYAGYIHDLGKLAIPTAILEKPGPLTKREFAFMKSHSYHTHRVLAKVSGFETIRIWGSLHHEKLNGKGYPFGLKENEIPLGARIMAVADIFTAIREKRPYRAPMTKIETINTLIKLADANEIDSDIVRIIQNNFDEVDFVREKANKEAIDNYERFHSDFMKNINIIENKEKQR